MKKVYRGILLLLFFTGLTIWYTWPLIRQFSTHSAGDGYDGIIFLWNLWWIKKSLLTLHQLPYLCPFLFHPAGINLVTHTLNITHGVIALMLHPFFSLITAHNILLFFSYIVTAWGMYLLCFFLAKNRLAALLAVIMFTFCSFKLNHGSHFNLLSTEWIPFFIYFFIKGLYGKKTIPYGIYAGIFLSLTFYSSYYLASFLMLFIVIFLLYMVLSHLITLQSVVKNKLQNTIAFLSNIVILFSFILFLCILFSQGITFSFFSITVSIHSTKNPFIIFILLLLLRCIYATFCIIKNKAITLTIDRFKLITKKAFTVLIPIGIVFFILSIPFLFGFQEYNNEGNIFPKPTLDELKSYSGDLEALFMPTNWFFHQATEKIILNKYRTYGEWCIFPGYLALLFFVYALVFLQKKKEKNVWILCAIFFLLLSGGPYLLIGGKNTEIMLPLYLLRHLPFIGDIRVPARFGIMMMFALSIISAFSFTHILSFLKSINNTRGKFLSFCFVCISFSIVFFECSFFPTYSQAATNQPLTRIPDPEEYSSIICKNCNNCAILDLPIGWKDGYSKQGHHRALQQYYQVFHNKRIVSGECSRIPKTVATFIRKNAVLQSFAALDYEQFPDYETLFKFVKAYQIHFIIINKSFITKKHHQMLYNYFSSFPYATLIKEGKELDIFSCTIKKEDKITIDFNGIYASLLPFYGWSTFSGAKDDGSVLYAIQKNTRLLLPVMKKDNQYILKLIMKSYANKNSAIVSLNTDTIGQITLSPLFKEYSFSIPSHTLSKDNNILDIRFSGEKATSPYKNRKIGNTRVFYPTDIYILSEGFLHGNSSSVIVNGKDYSKNETGYNIVVINKETGVVKNSVQFNTHKRSDAAHAMIQFIKEIKEGDIVALSVKDEASVFFTDEAEEALQLLGGKETLKECYRWGYALLGVKGAKRGEALEVKKNTSIEIGIKRVFGVLQRIELSSQKKTKTRNRR
ncbi:interleukin-like EMT inducer domain-containing protein [Chlamydiota bacterium]